MKAVVFHNPKDVWVDTVANPILKHSEDIILKVTATAFCEKKDHCVKVVLTP